MDITTTFVDPDATTMVYSFAGVGPVDRDRVLAMTFPAGRFGSSVAVVFNVRDEEYPIFEHWYRDFIKELKTTCRGQIWTLTKYPNLRLECRGYTWILITHRGVVLYEHTTRPDKDLISAVVNDHNDTLGREEFHYITTVNTQHIF